MPKIKYIDKKFGKDAMDKIDRANTIIAEYDAQGYELTLRQIYYQFVSRDIIANNTREYKNLGSVLNDARLAGLIDWNAIVDRTRNLQSVGHWDSPADIISSAAAGYHIDKWEVQRYRIEVWVEKDALIGVVERAARAEDVAYFSCRGYTSQSELWSAGRRLRSYRSGGQIPVVLHFGDHDPSGMDMTRDIRDRLEMFSGDAIEVRRLALNFAQVEQYEPPPNPAKLTDSRATSYISEHGNESWELDALEPSVIEQLIRSEIQELRDTYLWEKAVEKENEDKRKLKAVSDRWEKLTRKL